MFVFARKSNEMAVGWRFYILLHFVVILRRIILFRNWRERQRHRKGGFQFKLFAKSEPIKASMFGSSVCEMNRTVFITTTFSPRKQALEAFGSNDKNCTIQRSVNFFGEVDDGASEDITVCPKIICPLRCVYRRYSELIGFKISCKLGTLRFILRRTCSSRVWSRHSTPPLKTKRMNVVPCW